MVARAARTSRSPAKASGVGFAFGECAFGDGAGGRQDGEGESVVHGGGGGGVDEFRGDAAELVGEAGDPAGLDEVATLPEGGLGLAAAAAG